MFIKNEYTNTDEECSQPSNSVQNINLESNSDNSPEFVNIKCEIEFEDSSSIKEEPLTDEDEGSYTENVDSTHIFSQDHQQNISLLECSNFTSSLSENETSMSPYNNDVKQIEVTISPITQKISLNPYNQGSMQCQRKNVVGCKQMKNKVNTKCSCQVYTHLIHMFNGESKQTLSFTEKDCSIKKQFWCDICKKRFQSRSTIIRHMQVHNENKRYACKICNKKFSCAGLIKPHMRSHTGEKPYTCLICKNRFSHKCNMQRHMERHKRVKNLNCSVCGKTFPMESRLKYHMRTHTNEKPFKCGICKKVFSHKQNLQRHYVAKHPMDKFICTETDASVARIVWDKIVNKVVELLPN